MRASLSLSLPLVLLACLGCDSSTSPVAPDDTTLRIDANPSTIAVTGTSTILVTAIDNSRGVPARAGTEILLTTTLGIIEERIFIDGRGIGRATLRADGRAGKATVRASSGKAASVTTEITIGAATPQVLKAAFVPKIGESLTVVFEDSSEGNPTSWEWDFGDGARSTEREPVHTFAEAGSYVVTLKVRNPDGQDTLSQRITVPASEASPPVAAFSVAVNGMQATFTDESTNRVASWEWEFGDGARSAVQSPVHLYDRPGIYTVSLTVRNAAGTSSASKSITVPQSAVPDANFSFREVEDLKVIFLDASSNAPTSWEWDFGDRTPGSTEQNPSHTYSAPGLYTVSLTASNLAGRSVETKLVEVRGPLRAAFSSNVQGRTVIFTDRSLGEPTSFEWTFGDEAPDAPGVTARNPVHTYLAAGRYPVTLTVKRTVSGGSAQEESTVTQFITVP